MDNEEEVKRKWEEQHKKQRELAYNENRLYCAVTAEENSKNDLIDHPKHYTQGIECWDYITSHDMGYLEGNIIKYVTRYKHKNGIQDLKKAKAYLEKLINSLDKLE